MKLFCVDAESDGLYGVVWAVGAVVYDKGVETAAFSGCWPDLSKIMDHWVQANVLPACQSLPKLEPFDLLEKFWQFYEFHRQDALIIADFGTPVEALLFRECVGLHRQKREFQGPYPLHELGTLLFAAGIDPDTDRRALCGHDGVRHNPLEDARCTAKCWIRAWQMIAGEADSVCCGQASGTHSVS